jgi:hypothetical protein
LPSDRAYPSVEISLNPRKKVGVIDKTAIRAIKLDPSPRKM